MTLHRARRLLLLATTTTVLAATATAPSGGTPPTSGPAAAAAVAVRPPAPCPTTTAHPWCDKRLSASVRADKFVAAMTQDEKVSLLGGQGVQHNGIVPGGHTGATIAVPRLGLPVVYLSDGPVGVRQGVATALPIPMALSATWDLGLARRAGRAVATEARAKGNDIVLGPSVNILRTPQNGRTYESYGEETLQNARTGVAWVQGAQSTGVIADIKHYAGNNQEGQTGLPPFVSAEGGRTRVSANMSQRTLREVYLPHFEAAVKQGRVGTLMCSYNKINGVHVCENPFLLDTVLRKQWGFRGMVIADYGASKGTATGLNAGLDFVPAQGSLDRSYSPAQIQQRWRSGRSASARWTSGCTPSSAPCSPSGSSTVGASWTTTARSPSPSTTAWPARSRSVPSRC